MQPSGGNPASGRRPSPSHKWKQPVGILRRSSTTDANKSYDVDRSTKYDYYTDETSKRNGDVKNYQHSTAVIKDVDELADRLLQFKHSHESSASSAAGNKYVPVNHSYMPMNRNHRHRTPPPSPQTASISPRKQRSRSEVMSTSSSNNEFDHQVQQHRRSPNKSWCDAAEEEYVRRMSAIKLDQSDRSVRGGASSSEHWSEKQNREIHESFNSSYSSPSKRNATSSPSSGHPKLPFFPKSPSASSAQVSLRNSRSRSRGKGRSKSTDRRVPVDPPFDECKNDLHHRNCTQQIRSGCDDVPDFASPKHPSESSTMSRRSSSHSRVRGRSRSRSASRTLSNQNRDKDEVVSMSTDEMGIRRAKSSEQLHHLRNSTERQRRTRSPHNSKGPNNHSNGREKSWTKALGNFRDKFLSHSNHASSSKSLSQETSSQRRHRSRSRGERRPSEKEECNDDGMSLGKGLKALDKAKRGRSRDRPSKMSQSYDGRSNLGSNSFVHKSTKVSFDKKTGRCKKHPSILMAKKSAFRSGSWEVVRQCPFCAESKEDQERKFDEETKGRMDILSKDGQDFNGDSSMAQFSKKSEDRTMSSRANNNNRKGNSTPSKQNVIDAIPEGLREKNTSVSRMRYTTPMGETGWYTGEVDSDEQPHGYGRMRYKTGNSYEGEWIHGYTENHLENLNRMKLKSGFGSNKATRRKSETNRSMGASSRLHRRG